MFLRRCAFAQSRLSFCCSECINLLERQISIHNQYLTVFVNYFVAVGILARMRACAARVNRRCSIKCLMQFDI